MPTPDLKKDRLINLFARTRVYLMCLILRYAFGLFGPVKGDGV